VANLWGATRVGVVLGITDSCFTIHQHYTPKTEHETAAGGSQAFWRWPPRWPRGHYHSTCSRLVDSAQRAIGYKHRLGRSPALNISSAPPSLIATPYSGCGCQLDRIRISSSKVGLPRGSDRIHELCWCSGGKIIQITKNRDPPSIVKFTGHESNSRNLATFQTGALKSHECQGFM